MSKSLVFEFLAISDIHLKHNHSIETIRLEKAIKLGYMNTNNLDLIVCSGDYSDGGHDPQYAQFVKILNEQVKHNTQVIINHGNHENGRFESDSHEYFREIFGYGVDYMWNINGYYFITLGVNHTDRYLDTQAKWLKSKLKIASENNTKPIFVLTHYPVYGTVVSNLHNSKETFNEVLKDYPNVINISGHTHQALNDPRIIHQENYTSYNNGSLSYLIINHYEFDSPYDVINKGHFSIFKIYDDNTVVIEKHILDDSSTNPKSTKLENDIIINIALGKEGFTYKNRYFDDGSIPTFDNDTTLYFTKENDEVYLNFTQATDKIGVYYYNVIVKDVSTNSIIYDTKYHSQFYENIVPKILKSKFKHNLSSGNEYEINVTAYNFANRASETKTFKITY